MLEVTKHSKVKAKHRLFKFEISTMYSPISNGTFNIKCIRVHTNNISNNYIIKL